VDPSSLSVDTLTVGQRILDGVLGVVLLGFDGGLSLTGE